MSRFTLALFALTFAVTAWGQSIPTAYPSPPCLYPPHQTGTDATVTRPYPPATSAPTTSLGYIEGTCIFNPPTYYPTPSAAPTYPVPQYGECDGYNYLNEAECASPYECIAVSDFLSQCL